MVKVNNYLTLFSFLVKALQPLLDGISSCLFLRMAVNHLFPEWDVWTQFINDDFSRGLSLDALESSHPIQVDVKSPAE